MDPKGVLSIALVRLSVGPSVCWFGFEYLRDRFKDFYNFCMKLGHYKGTKVTEPDFLKRILGVANGEKLHFWGIFDVFCPYLKNGSKDFNEILRIDT